MNNGLVITVNLPGRIGSSVRHTETQTVRADISPAGSKRPIWGNKEIQHTDRGEQICYRKVNISPEVLEEWIGGKPPYHVKAHDWQKYNRARRIIAHVSSFDEGYGVEYSEI